MKSAANRRLSDRDRSSIRLTQVCDLSKIDHPTLTWSITTVHPSVSFLGVVSSSSMISPSLLPSSTLATDKKCMNSPPTHAHYYDSFSSRWPSFCALDWLDLFCVVRLTRRQFKKCLLCSSSPSTWWRSKYSRKETNPTRIPLPMTDKVEETRTEVWQYSFGWLRQSHLYV